MCSKHLTVILFYPMENRLQSRLGRGGLIIDACRKRVYESSLLKSNLFLNIMRGRAISTEKLSCGNIKSERELIVMKMRKLMKVWSIQEIGRAHV